jgi:hypothetical protein
LIRVIARAGHVELGPRRLWNADAMIMILLESLHARTD